MLVFLKIGAIGGSVGIAQQNHLAQTSGGQTLINSNTTLIKAVKGMEIWGDLDVSNNNNSSTISSNEETITNLNASTLVVNPVKIGGINGDAVFSNINHFNSLDFALALIASGIFPGARGWNAPSVPAQLEPYLHCFRTP